MDALFVYILTFGVGPMFRVKDSSTSHLLLYVVQITTLLLVYYLLLQLIGTLDG